MIVLDLAIVTKVVHDHSTEYQILTSQCFWFVAVIVSVLQKSFPQIKASNGASMLNADHGQDLAVEFSDKKGGTYRRIPIYSERLEVITEIYHLFETYKDQVYSSVNILNTGCNFFADYSLIHYLRSRKPHSMLNGKWMRTEKHRKRWRRHRKRSRECRKRTRGCRKRTRESRKRRRMRRGGHVGNANYVKFYVKFYVDLYVGKYRHTSRDCMQQ